MKIKQLHALFLIGFCGIMFPAIVRAAQISEIAYDLDGSDDKREWIEIYNDELESLSLEGWSLTIADEQTKHSVNFMTEKGGRGDPTLLPGGYAIVASDAATFIAESLNYTGAVADSSMSLPNYSASRTEPISIKFYDKDGGLRLTASYLPTQGFAAGKTIEWVSGGWQTSLHAGGTPGGAPESLPVVIPALLRLVAILPNPDGADTDAEWIELENYGTASADIDGWYVSDKATASGSVHKQTVPSGISVAAGSRYRLVLSGSFLNNSDEEVLLYRPDGTVVETVAVVGTAPEGVVYRREGEAWQWESIHTPPATPSTVPSTSAAKVGTAKSPTGQSSPSVAAVVAKISPKSTASSKVVGKTPTPKTSPTKKTTPTPKLPTASSAVAGISAGPPTITVSKRAQIVIGVLMALLGVGIVIHRFQLHLRLLDWVRYGILRRK